MRIIYNISDDCYFSTIKGIKLYPTPSQKDFIDRCIDGYRIVYNWALKCEENNYELHTAGLSQHSFLDFYILQSLYKDFRKNTPFLQTLPSHSMINAIKDMVHGYILFFKKASIRSPGYKKYVREAFSSYKPRSEPSVFYFNDNYLRIEGLPYYEMIKTSYHTNTYPKDKIKYINPVILRNNYTGEYTLQYVTIRHKLTNELVNISISDPIGVDVNKQKLYACSNGLIISYVATNREERHLADINRAIQWDRNKYKELEEPLSNSALYRLEERRQMYAHIANIHRNNCYNGALQIVRCNPEAIILEDLDLRSMAQVSYIADDLQFHPLGISQQILENQAFKYDIPVYYAPKGFPSSNICSNCGTHKDIKMNKYFRCDNCGLVLDRDINAAINLKNWYIQNKDNL